MLSSPAPPICGLTICVLLAAFCDISEPIAHLQTNYTYWKEQEPKAAQELLERQRREDEEAPVAPAPTEAS
jgi:hypothetical protein